MERIRVMTDSNFRELIRPKAILVWSPGDNLSMEVLAEFRSFVNQWGLTLGTDFFTADAEGNQLIIHRHNIRVFPTMLILRPRDLAADLGKASVEKIEGADKVRREISHLTFCAQGHI